MRNALTPTYTTLKYIKKIINTRFTLKKYILKFLKRSVNYYKYQYVHLSEMQVIMRPKILRGKNTRLLCHHYQKREPSKNA